MVKPPGLKLQWDDPETESSVPSFHPACMRSVGLNWTFWLQNRLQPRHCLQTIPRQLPRNPQLTITSLKRALHF